MKSFDRKFGEGFLSSVPHAPGVYRLYGEQGDLLYVGKAKDLRRRLAQYRNARRRKKDKKKRSLVDEAVRIEVQACESELEALILETRLIQALRPAHNVSGAFSFLYPFVGLMESGTDTYFCFTTDPEAFPTFELFGAFRSREVVGEGFFSLMRLLKYVGHPVPRHECEALGKAKHSYLFGFRRLPSEFGALWRECFRGLSLEAVATLAERLLEKASARSRSDEIQEDLRSVRTFYRSEAEPLAKAISKTGYVGYPVPQKQRDPLFLRFRKGEA